MKDYFGRKAQKIYLDDFDEEQDIGNRRATRIELRSLKNAYTLKTGDTPITQSQSPEELADLKRLTGYATAEYYNLKDLYNLLKMSKFVDKVQLHFGECLYASIKFESISPDENRLKGLSPDKKFSNGYGSRIDRSFDISKEINGNSEEPAVWSKNEEKREKQCDLYFLEYGVVVMWGCDEKEERKILKMISPIEEKPYKSTGIESEKFLYGVSSFSRILNSTIYLKEENIYVKMVISIALAQSIRLDYFEEMVEKTITQIKGLPDEVEKEGKVGKSRKEILQLMGRFHKLNFNLYLVSNILGEPDFIWENSSFSPLYDSCVRYLDIKQRTEILKTQCDTIHGILDILKENITTYNSEKLETTMTWLIGINTFFGLIQCSLLMLLAWKYFSSS